ncbi:hypothetical protein FC831_13900 [Clostridium botulinum]|nr:hypothetical protein [Clostridium botulinum]
MQGYVACFGNFKENEREKNKVKFKREYLIEELGLPWDTDVIHKEIIDTTRWSVIKEIVFQDKDGRYYQTTYSEGATECQDESPWEYEDEVECVEVELKEVLVKKWVAIG